MAVTQKRKRPFVLGVFAFILSGQAIILPMLFLGFLLTPSTSPINYNGVDVPMGEVRSELLGTMLIWFVFAAYIGPGLWKGKPMARHIAFGSYVSILSIMIIVLRDWLVVPWAIVCVLIVGGYLYAKSNVRSFFETFEESN